MTTNLNCGPINVAEIIRIARQQTGLTQEQFCAMIGAAKPFCIQISRRNLSKYETGENIPPADKYLKILRVSECLTL